MDFRRSLNPGEMRQWGELLEMIKDVRLSGEADKVTWALEKSGNFTTKSMYTMLVHRGGDKLPNEEGLELQNSFENQDICMADATKKTSNCSQFEGQTMERESQMRDLWEARDGGPYLLLLHSCKVLLDLHQRSPGMVKDTIWSPGPHAHLGNKGG